MSEVNRIELAMQLTAMELATIEPERWGAFVLSLLGLLHDKTDAHSYQTFLRWLHTDIGAMLTERTQ